MTDESIARSRPRREPSKRVQSELYNFPQSTRNTKRRAIASSSRTRLDSLEDEEEDESSGEEEEEGEEYDEEDAASGPEEITSGPEEGGEEEEVNDSIANTSISQPPVFIERESTPMIKYTSKKSKQARAQHRFPHSFTNTPQYFHGIVPDADVIHQQRKGESEESKAISSQIATLTEEVLKETKTIVKVLTEQEARKYSKGKKMNGTESFLKPSEETFANVEAETKLISDVKFTELLPFIGDRLSVEMGTQKAMKRIRMEKYDSIPLDEATKMDVKQGVMFNVGSHVYSMDWSYKSSANKGVDQDDQYLCVSAAIDQWPRTNLVERIEKGSQPGVLQIWSISKRYWQTKLEMKLCFDGGRMSSVRWVPLFDDYTKADTSIGLLSVAMQDGNVGIYSVPSPHTLDIEGDDEEDIPFIKLEPLLVFRFSQGAPVCMEWQDSNLLAVGYSDGHVVVWNLQKALQEQKESIKDKIKPIIVPDMCIRASRSPIADLTWGRKGENELYISGYDGSIYHATLANSDFCPQLIRTRDTFSAIAFDSTTNLALHERLKDCCIQTIEFPQKTRPSSRLVYPHYGRIRSLHTSPHHPFMASGGSDGTVRVGNVPALMLKNTRRWAGGGTHTIYRLDFPDRGSNCPIRFIEPLATYDTGRFPPDGLFDSTKISKFSSFASKQGLTLAWHPAVNVTCVIWNLNSECETWLASGTAVGLVRIDVVGKPSQQTSDNEEEEVEVEKEA